jgi:hypothetical protein
MVTKILTTAAVLTVVSAVGAAQAGDRYGAPPMSAAELSEATAMQEIPATQNINLADLLAAAGLEVLPPDLGIDQLLQLVAEAQPTQTSSGTNTDTSGVTNTNSDNQSATAIATSSRTTRQTQTSQ